MHICSSYADYQKLSAKKKLQTYLTEDEVMNVPLEECSHPLVDLREMDTRSLLVFNVDIPNTLLRQEAAEKLLIVAKQLADRGYTLELYEAFRAYEKQKKEFLEISDEMAKKNPDLKGKELWLKITEFIADPDLAPPHCAGSAVDVRLLDKNTNEVIDMGIPINSVAEESYLFHPSLSEQAKVNRQILLDAMLNAGFAPLPTEWWHYSYGDRYWGAFYSQAAMYGTIKEK